MSEDSYQLMCGKASEGMGVGFFRAGRDVRWEMEWDRRGQIDRID